MLLTVWVGMFGLQRRQTRCQNYHILNNRGYFLLSYLHNHTIHHLGMSALTLLEQMQAATVLPLVGLLVVSAVYALHMEVVHLMQSKEVQRSVHDRCVFMLFLHVLCLYFPVFANRWCE